MRRCALLGAAALAVVLTAMPRPVGGLAAPGTAASRLYVVFLPGLCGWTGSDRYCRGNINAAARARGTFRTLIAQLAAARIRYTPIYYSYRANSPTYTVGDTHSSVARDVTALERQLRAVWKTDASARFVLIGHSLGGVVAASWAVTNGREYGRNFNAGLLRRTASIVTYDSPLKGLYGKFWTNPVTRLFAGDVWYSLQTSSETIKEITFFPDRWWRNTGHLHSIANSADEIVPPTESLLGDKKLVFDSACPRDILVFRTCHGAVLSDVALNRFVACRWITGPYACTPRPTATPTATPTVTPVPTATPTATLPAATATATASVTATGTVTR